MVINLNYRLFCSSSTTLLTPWRLVKPSPTFPAGPQKQWPYNTFSEKSATPITIKHELETNLRDKIKRGWSTWSCITRQPCVAIRLHLLAYLFIWKNQAKPMSQKKMTKDHVHLLFRHLLFCNFIFQLAEHIFSHIITCLQVRKKQKASLDLHR